MICFYVGTRKQTTSFNNDGNKRLRLVQIAGLKQLVPRQVIRFKLFVVILSGVAAKTLLPADHQKHFVPLFNRSPSEPVIIGSVKGSQTRDDKKNRCSCLAGFLAESRFVRIV